jgi:hypothetical protein
MISTKFRLGEIKSSGICGMDSKRHILEFAERTQTVDWTILVDVLGLLELSAVYHGAQPHAQIGWGYFSSGAAREAPIRVNSI